MEGGMEIVSICLERPCAVFEQKHLTKSALYQQIE